MSEPGAVEVKSDAFNYEHSDDCKKFTASSMSIDENGPEPLEDRQNWKGVSMDEIRKGLGVYDYQEFPSISRSLFHVVLVKLPLPAHGVPEPYPSSLQPVWSEDYVKMPYSVLSTYPVNEYGPRRYCRRWEMIQKSLLQYSMSLQQLEAAILSYNHMYVHHWNFAALHHFFSEEVDEEEMNIFFEVLLPKIVQLALQLPVLVTGALPLLKRHNSKTISLSQLQIASLLANAFFCTFPKRNTPNSESEYRTFPYINFNRLFSACTKDKSMRCPVMEKIKCIFHYFRRVTTKAPEGMVTIHRRYIPKRDCPKWNKQEEQLPPLHITSKGTIETEGAGLLQVDFANKYVGGGVLGFGCLQEEIRFVTYPELLVTMLVTEELDEREALIISGVERYSHCKGYNNTFKWIGDYVDETPRDSSGRRITSVVAIDALPFRHAQAQFNINNIRRELNKAYAGFAGCETMRNNLSAVATGNWGCGAFRGNPKLKVLLQLMAAGVAGRSVAYFTFGDKTLRDDIAEMYSNLVKLQINIAQIYSLLVEYQEFAISRSMDFYRFLYSRIKNEPLTVPTKEHDFKRSKSVSVDDRKCSYTDAKCSKILEKKIQKWLFDCEEGTSERKTDTIIEERAQGGTREEQNQSRDSLGKKEEHVQDKNCMKPLASKPELLDAKPGLISHQTNDYEPFYVQTNKGENEPMTISPKTHSTTESVQISNETSVPTTPKQDSLCKTQKQRKITEFFPPTS